MHITTWNGGTPWLTRDRLTAAALFLATLLVYYLGYLVALPFMPALAWAAFLAIIVYPLYQHMRRRLHKPSLAAVLVVAVVAATLVLPAFFIARQVVLEASSGVEQFKSGEFEKQWNRVAERYPVLAPAMKWIEREISLRDQADALAQKVLSGAKSAFSQSLYFLAGTLVTLYLLFYFLRDKAQILAALRSCIPLRTDETNRILHGVSDTCHAIVYGTLTVALVQGALGGFMFWLLDLPAPFIWGVIMALLAVLPVAGAALVWVPVAIYLAVQGDWDKAAILAAWGSIVVGLIDNVLYPILVRNRLHLHTIPVFISIVGGLMVFGLAGFVIGPVVLAVAAELAAIWRLRLADGNGLEAGANIPPGNRS